MKEEMQFLEVVQLIKQARVAACKSVNVELINCYWQVGEYISKRVGDASWGDKTVKELASFIAGKHPELRGYDRTGLYRMKKFYESYCGSAIVASAMRQIEGVDNQSDIIVSSTMTQLENTQLGSTDIRHTMLSRVSWTHHLNIITRARDIKEREFYLQLCIQERYSVKELDRQINSGVYERVMLGKEQLPKAIKNSKADVMNVFKSDYVLDFLNLPKEHTETDLQKALILQMKDFVLELGKDFLFMGEEYRIQVGNSDFVIDLLFYHRGLQCLVAFELKTEKFKPEHLGQLNFYLEALDQDVKKEQENPSIGILLCQGQDKEVVRYALNRSMSPTLVAAYQMQLPDKEVLQRKWQELFENGMGGDKNGFGSDDNGSRADNNGMVAEDNGLDTDNKKPADLF